MNSLGISRNGISTALQIKDSYKKREPLVVPGESDRLLVPEALLNSDLDLSGFEDPLALAVMCTRDPENSMALAATARLCPIGNSTELVRGVVDIIGETSRHELVRECLKYVTDNAFEIGALHKVQDHAARLIVESRRLFTAKLRDILSGLMDGSMAPRIFAREFFELTEAGNLRHDVRKKLVLSLLLSPAVRPSIKFVMLENFGRLPKAVQLGIVSAVLKAEPTRHTEIIKEELHYIIFRERAEREGHDVNGRPANSVPLQGADEPMPLRATGAPPPTPLSGPVSQQASNGAAEPTPWFLV